MLSVSIRLANDILTATYKRHEYSEVSTHDGSQCIFSSAYSACDIPYPTGIIICS